MDGTKLWRIDFGKNIRAGAHYTQFIVYDPDGDGRAKVACKTAPGTKDGSGNFLKLGPAAIDEDNADYRTSGCWPGFFTSKPEYLTIFIGANVCEIVIVYYELHQIPSGFL